MKKITWLWLALLLLIGAALYMVAQNPAQPMSASGIFFDSVTAPTCTGNSARGILWNDNGNNRLKQCINGNGAENVGNALVLNCGTTTTCSNAVLNAPQIQKGTVTLSAGAATLSGITGFTSTSSFVCIATDQTAANAVKCVPASATSVTFAGTTTDVIAYELIGN